MISQSKISLLDNLYSFMSPYKTLYIGLLVLISSTINAQVLKDLLIEDFLDNRNNWPIENFEKGVFKLKKGKLTVKAEGTKKIIFIDRPIDATKDWTIEIDAIQYSLHLMHSWGIVIGNDDDLNYHILKKSNQFFYFTSSIDGIKSHDCLKTLMKDEIIESGEHNLLKIINKNGKTTFYINNKEIYSCPSIKILGPKFGLFIEKGNEIQFHKIQIKGTEGKYTKTISKTTFKKRHLGTQINTIYDEIAPLVSANGKQLYFTSKYHPDNTGGSIDDARVSQKDSNGTWGKGEWMSSPINTNELNMVRGIGSGGNALLLANQYKNGKVVDIGFSMTHKTEDGWSHPENLIIDDYYNLDPNNLSSSSWSANESILIISVVRNDSKNNSKDLYVSFKKKGKENEWTKPLNLGDDINTAGRELTPFLAPDNKTLYFSSNGHPNLGGQDIFMCKRLDDTWTKWSKPKNLGSSINTKSDDMYFTLSASGEYAYMTTTDNSLYEGYLDIVEIKMKAESKPEPVILVSGYVLEKNSLQPIPASITIHQLIDNEEIANIHVDPKSGYYEIVLPKGGEYSFYAENQKYYSIRENLLVEDSLTEFKEIKMNLYLSPIIVGNKIQLNNLFFVRSKPIMIPTSKPELDKLVQILKANPKIEISIEGHTDNMGSVRLNQELSENRAKTVYTYLIESGVSKNRLSYKGYGGTKPLVKNINETMRKKNRRVEFLITKS